MTSLSLYLENTFTCYRNQLSTMRRLNGVFICLILFITKISYAKDKGANGDMVNIVAFGEGRCSDTS